MNTGDVVFVLSAFWGYFDSHTEEWLTYKRTAGVFLSASEALKAAESVAPIEEGFDMSDIDTWEYTIGENLADGIEPLPEYQERIKVFEWEIEPIRIGEMALCYRDPEEYQRRQDADVLRIHGIVRNQ